MKKTTADKNILAAQASLDAAKKFSSDVYARSDEFSKKQNELIAQIKEVKKQQPGQSNNTLADVLDSAKFRHDQAAALQTQVDELGFALQTLNGEKAKSAAAVEVAKNALYEARIDFAAKKQDALSGSPEFKKLRAKLIEVCSFAAAAARSVPGGRLDDEAFVSDVFGELEFSDEQWDQALVELGMADEA